jgi:hypothetical protein
MTKKIESDGILQPSPPILKTPLAADFRVSNLANFLVRRHEQN